MPARNADVFRTAGIRPARGILMYGPSGTGKTYLARAVAHEAGLNFLSVKGPEVQSKWIGEGERNVRTIFRKAREQRPCILFWDEIDSIVSQPSSTNSRASLPLLAQFLTEMDGFEPLEGVFVIATTNRRDCMDSAVLRSGRFDRKIEIPLPDHAARRKIFEEHLEPLHALGDLRSFRWGTHPVDRLLARMHRESYRPGRVEQALEIQQLVRRDFA